MVQPTGPSGVQPKRWLARCLDDADEHGGSSGAAGQHRRAGAADGHGLSELRADECGQRDSAGPGGAAGEVLLGKPAPAFTTTDVDGKAVKLSDYKGKVVLVDFWAKRR